MSSKSLNWTSGGFRELNLDSLYDILALRCKVFIVEQGPYLDVDGLDQHSWHLQGRDSSGALLAYLRVVEPGLKFDEPSIGRVVVDAFLRGSGAGDELVRQGVEHCVATWPGRGIRISAQAHLQRFYGRQGFVTVGDEYLEDEIPHVEMFRAP
jgi:ElaA protein